MASDSTRREDLFQKKICPKRTFPSNFVKLVSKILYLFLAEKMVVCCLFVVCLLFVCCLFVVCLLFVCCLFVVCLLFVCCLFVVYLLFVVVCCLFVATLSDFGLLFFLIEALIELRKMLLRKKLFDVRFGNCLTPKVPRFCRFTKMQLTYLGSFHHLQRSDYQM